LQAIRFRCLRREEPDYSGQIGAPGLRLQNLKPLLPEGGEVNAPIRQRAHLGDVGRATHEIRLGQRAARLLLAQS
jgi:hypothetical protein